MSETHVLKAAPVIGQRAVDRIGEIAADRMIAEAIAEKRMGPRRAPEQVRDGSLGNGDARRQREVSL